MSHVGGVNGVNPEVLLGVTPESINYLILWRQRVYKTALRRKVEGKVFGDVDAGVNYVDTVAGGLGESPGGRLPAIKNLDL